MKALLLFCLLCLSSSAYCYGKIGPDPWNIEVTSPMVENNVNTPPDLRPLQNKLHDENHLCMGEIYYKRLLGILLKGSHVKIEEDGNVQIIMQMRFNNERWVTLKKHLATEASFSEEIFRRSLGHIEESVYTPSIIEQIVYTWREYLQIYFIEYKIYISWILGAIGAFGALIWLWNCMSYKHILVIMGLFLYLYEVFVSYKEAEQREYDNFVSALNTCKWKFWSSSCDVPAPDPVIFIKHMNPLKIAIRMFATFITEPMISVSDAVKVIVHNITDGLWYPFDKIVYAMLLLFINVLIIIFIIMLFVNYILNIPFTFNISGLFSINVLQRNRTISAHENQTIDHDRGDRISGATLNKVLDIVSNAVNVPRNTVRENPLHLTVVNKNGHTGMRRSASAGRLTNIASTFDSNNMIISPLSNVRKRILPNNGSGDASMINQ